MKNIYFTKAKYGNKTFSLLMTICLLSLLSLVNPAFSAIFRYDGPYEGKVIDADTGNPIEGAVVLGVWNRIHSNVAGWNYEFYDAVETVTDNNGNFHIKGLGPLFFSNIDDMKMVIFKVEYEHLATLWESLKKDYYLRTIIKWEDDKAIIPLKKLNLEQRLNRFGDYSTHIPKDKMKLLIREIENEEKSIGRK